MEVFSLSALDLFCSAMGAMMILTFVLLPYFKRQARTNNLDLAIVLDTTGSMREEIEDLQRNIGSTTIALHRLCRKLRIGVVAYRDKADADESYVTRSFPLTELPKADNGGKALRDLRRFVDALDADGGGDVPEDMLAGVNDALRMRWNDTSGADLSIIVLVADAPPHPDEADELRRRLGDWSRGKGSRRIMLVHTGGPSDDNMAFFQSVAEALGSKTGEAKISGSSLLGDILDVVLK
jgi:hypothetical protein